MPILLIGDSTDRFIQQDVCELGRMVGARTESIGFDTDQTTLRVSLLSCGCLHTIHDPSVPAHTLQPCLMLQQCLGVYFACLKCMRK